MPIEPWRDLIERIHAASRQAVIVATGGGASAISDLLSVPGGSRTLLEAVVPYSEEALVEWLGKAPEHFCVEETALAMAAVAHQRGCQLIASRQQERAGNIKSTPAHSATAPFDNGDAIGVACTASLVSDRPKKGDHRCHVATQTRSATASCSLVLEKGARDRPGEERLVGRLTLLALARAAGIDSLPELDLRSGEKIVQHAATADALLRELLDGKRAVVWSLPDVNAKGEGEIREPRQKDEHFPAGTGFSLHAAIPVPLSHPAGVLCGSFHPLHFGHRQLRETAERIIGGPVYFEMSIRNVDKPPLDFLSIDRRRAQFTDVPLALTTAPTFAEKAMALPGVVFAVGVDTAERIVQCKYYGGSDEATRAALDTIHSAGCRFLVAGRKVGERFETLADIEVPREFAALFTAIPPHEFRADVSSTELRRNSGD